MTGALSRRNQSSGSPCKHISGGGSAPLTVDHDAKWLMRILNALRSRRELRIIDQDRIYSDCNGVDVRPLLMCPGQRGRAAHPARISRPCTDFAIQTHGEFGCHKGKAGRAVLNVTGERA